MLVKNPASALGEAVGKLIEDELERTLSPLCSKRGFIYDRGGERPSKRTGVKVAMVNKSGNVYQLDGVIENSVGEPVVILESKYLRYKKHNRDKGSWTCAAHYSIRKSHPTIRKSIAVLSGNWSTPSKKFMESFGIELYEIPFDLMCKVLEKYGIEFDWHEKDQVTPQDSWRDFQKLNDEQKRHIGEELVNQIRDPLVRSVATTLELEEDWAKRLQEVELLLKTDRNEYFTYSFAAARDAIQFLLSLQVDAPDLRGKL
jgi:hypothetical protein